MPDLINKEESLLESRTVETVCAQVKYRTGEQAVIIWIDSMCVGNVAKAECVFITGRCLNSFYKH